ncbi:MAG: AAA family ATPase [Thermaerobacter sp.]|nr:AAA family ATPase [Thermaerobacter sp.]
MKWPDDPDVLDIFRRCELAPEELRRTYQDAEVELGKAGELDAGAVIGQQRAVRAIDFGLRMNRADYHLVVVGPVGTGRTSYVKAATAARAREMETPRDWCYVPNFDRPDHPIAMSLPAGQGRRFRDAVDLLAADVGRQLREAFEDEVYAKHRQGVVRRYEESQQTALSQLLQSALARGFTVQRDPAGNLLTVPLKPDGQPFHPGEWAELSEALRQHFGEKQKELDEVVTATTHQLRTLSRDAGRELQELDRNVVRHVATRVCEPLLAEWAAHPAALAYLEALQNDLMGHGTLLQSDQTGTPEAIAARYRIHVMVDHYDLVGAPVVVESNPTFGNLFGRMEYETISGGLYTHLRLLKPGSMHMANGGFLILQARDLVGDPLVYATLKRVLKHGSLRIENVPEHLAAVPATFQPAPVPIALTVVLVAPPELYYTLYREDEEFRRLFKVKAEFEPDMLATAENIRHFGSLVQTVALRDEGMPLDPDAVARLAEWSTRLAEDRDRLSTRFGEVLDLMAEAAVWARAEGLGKITGAVVNRALGERSVRGAAIEERIRHMMTEGSLMVDTEGVVSGQVNGLAVLNFGDAVFGRPVRITARCYASRSGIANIERQTRLSGRLHDKGVLVLSAFFAGRFAQDQPLTLGASLAFEQQYEEIDGDSASSAELYALMSELADAPINQGIAVTGSVNQKGEVQPIGGVNEKVEGFFRVCRAQGLSGSQGVIIPRRNVHQLMLAVDVVDAVRGGQFHVWAIDTVDEGMAILTGGRLAPSAGGAEDTLGDRIHRRLRSYGQVLECEEGRRC